MDKVMCVASEKEITLKGREAELHKDETDQLGEKVSNVA